MTKRRLRPRIRPPKVKPPPPPPKKPRPRKPRKTPRINRPKCGDLQVKAWVNSETYEILRVLLYERRRANRLTQTTFSALVDYWIRREIVEDRRRKAVLARDRDPDMMEWGYELKKIREQVKEFDKALAKEGHERK